MKAHEIKAAIERYNSRYDKHGHSEQALGWGEKGRAQLRYEILASRWDLTSASVLDFGCGFGDFRAYLKETRAFKGNYIGFDINPRFIKKAKELHPDADWYCKDLLNAHCDKKVDYTMSSGVFNHELEDNWGFIETAFARFAEISSRGFAVNFLSDQVDFQHSYTYHANPMEILELAYGYSRNVVLRNDYMPFEFTVFVDLSTAVNNQYTVFEDYINLI